VACVSVSLPLPDYGVFALLVSCVETLKPAWKTVFCSIGTLPQVISCGYMAFFALQNADVAYAGHFQNS
jgi:hypothetical protein